MEEKPVGEILKVLLTKLARCAYRLASTAAANGYVRSVAMSTLMTPSLLRIFDWIRSYLPKFVESAYKSSQVLRFIAGVYNWIREFFRRKPKNIKLTSQLPASASPYTHESVVQGSNEIPLPHGKSEVLLGNRKGVIFGKGCRIWNVLVTPAHVVQAIARQAEIDGRPTNTEQYFQEICAFSSKATAKNPNYVSLPFECLFIDLCNDMVGMLLPPDIWSKLGTSKVKIAALERPTMVTIVGVGLQGTTGILQNCSRVGFGYVSYSATTTRGYSGALYTSGQGAYAIHQMGGNPNLGIALDYVRSRIKLLIENYTHDESRDEDSSLDWANKDWFEGDRIHSGIRADFSALDEITVFAKGRYHVFDKDSLRERLGPAKWKSLSYADEYEPESERPVFHQSPSFGASNSLQGDPEALNPQDLVGTSKFFKALVGSQDAQLKSQSSRKKARAISNAVTTLTDQEIITLRRIAQDRKNQSGSAQSDQAVIHE